MLNNKSIMMKDSNCAETETADGYAYKMGGISNPSVAQLKDLFVYVLTSVQEATN